MDFTAEEKQKVKAMLIFLVKKKHTLSGGHCGFHPMELLEIMEELVSEGEIISRDTIHAKRYYLKPENKQ